MSLVRETSPLDRKIWQVEKDKEYRLGKNDQCDIFIDDSTIPAKQVAVLHVESGFTFLEALFEKTVSLDNSNHQLSLRKNRLYQILPGNRILIGSCSLLFQEAISDTQIPERQNTSREIFEQATLDDGLLDAFEDSTKDDATQLYDDSNNNHKPQSASRSARSRRAVTIDTEEVTQAYDGDVPTKKRETLVGGEVADEATQLYSDDHVTREKKEGTDDATQLYDDRPAPSPFIKPMSPFKKKRAVKRNEPSDDATQLYGDDEPSTSRVKFGEESTQLYDSEDVPTRDATQMYDDTEASKKKENSNADATQLYDDTEVPQKKRDVEEATQLYDDSVAPPQSKKDTEEATQLYDHYPAPQKKRVVEEATQLYDDSVAPPQSKKDTEEATQLYDHYPAPQKKRPVEEATQLYDDGETPQRGRPVEEATQLYDDTEEKGRRREANNDATQLYEEDPKREKREVEDATQLYDETPRAREKKDMDATQMYEERSVRGNYEDPTQMSDEETETKKSRFEDVTQLYDDEDQPWNIGNMNTDKNNNNSKVEEVTQMYSEEEPLWKRQKREERAVEEATQLYGDEPISRREAEATQLYEEEKEEEKEEKKEVRHSAYDEPTQDTETVMDISTPLKTIEPKESKTEEEGKEEKKKGESSDEEIEPIMGFMFNKISPTKSQMAPPKLSNSSTFDRANSASNQLNKPQENNIPEKKEEEGKKEVREEEGEEKKGGEKKEEEGKKEGEEKREEEVREKREEGRKNSVRGRGGVKRGTPSRRGRTKGNSIFEDQVSRFEANVPTLSQDQHEHEKEGEKERKEEKVEQTEKKEEEKKEEKMEEPEKKEEKMEEPKKTIEEPPEKKEEEKKVEKREEQAEKKEERSAEEYHNMKMPELKAECEKRGINTKPLRLKKQLVDALMDNHATYVIHVPKFILNPVQVSKEGDNNKEESKEERGKEEMKEKERKEEIVQKEEEKEEEKKEEKKEEEKKEEKKEEEKKEEKEKAEVEEKKSLEEPTNGKEEEIDYNDMKVPELKAECEKRGIDTKNLRLKKQLVEALSQESPVKGKEEDNLTSSQIESSSQSGTPKRRASNPPRPEELPSTPTKSGTPKTSPSQERSSQEVNPSPKRSRLHKRAANQKPVVMFTGIVDEERAKVITRLGGQLCSHANMGCTHVVTDKIKRTVKFMSALCVPAQFVHFNWIDECETAGHFVEEEPFLIRDVEGEERYKFNLLESCHMAATQKIMQGYKIHMTSKTKPSPTEFEEVIQSAGGTLSGKPGGHDEKMIIVSCEEDRKLWPGLREMGYKIHSTELLLSAVLQQRWDMNGHQLN
ncbi:hypothetical protein PROFUN_03154 [Planoprotostelium fungivorum]|uniref:BRCT domain-containing protein n=1 Tax=Planoprotostelium fungivorum TaxID=1890364 RepID=A0A2P6NWV4_9EUKA|nr:hypothetical protein PROFUN_03154 [Planoprotostelium fungivorum]